MDKIILFIVAVVSINSSLFAGNKEVVPVMAAIAPIVKDHEARGIYVSGAAYYNNIYADDYSWFNDTQEAQDEVAGFTAIAGYNYNEYFAFEARVSKQFFKDDYADEYHFGFFVKPQYRFRNINNYEDDYFTIYGLLGYGYVNVEGTDGNTPGDPTIIGKTLIDDWQFQYGMGLSYTFTDVEHPENDSGDWSIFAEYTMYMDTQSMEKTYLYDYDQNKYDELSMNGLTIGVSYQF